MCNQLADFISFAQKKYPHSIFRLNEPMAKHTTFKIGGAADLFILPASMADFILIIGNLSSYNIPISVIGNGSNILVSDEGIRGVVFSTKKGLNHCQVIGDTMILGAGVSLTHASNIATKNNLSGLEFASGIPGNIGGGIFMNAGAYGAAMSDIVEAVTAINYQGEILRYSKEKLNFAYRHSVFHEKDLFILETKLKLCAANHMDIEKKVSTYRLQRVAKQPLQVPNAGSIFKRPMGNFAGTLIEQAGLKGFTIGGAAVSRKHAGFIVNTGNATAKDVLRLIRHIQNVVEEKFQVKLETEVRIFKQGETRSMNIFVINCGSSSIKYQLINMKDESVLAKGLIERIGIEGSFLKHSPTGKDSVLIEESIPDHTQGIQMILDILIDPTNGVLDSLAEINAIGHRVAHGGERFTDSSLINNDVLKGIEACAEIAPLHNPPNLSGINACMKLMPSVPQIAVFDTAFHQTIPKVAFLYGLPYELYKKYSLRRYGFHGTSHKYVAQKAAEMMEEHMSDLRIVTCHLGNGASMAAIKNGRSVDTSMGFTPLEGLIMGTRSGEIDPAIIPFLMEKENMGIAEIDTLLNKKSGILGVSGLSSDFRDLEEAANNGHERAQLAIDMFAYKVRKYIGSYAAAMGGIDAIVFTAGLGENSAYMREKICNGLEYLGTRIDIERNNVRGVAQEISVRRSSVKIFVIPTNEELVIARDAYNLCKKIVR